VFGPPPHGIPIPMEVHELFPEEVKEAWAKFHAWYEEVPRDENGQISRSHMPREVKEAMKVVLEAPIPGYDGHTGEDSCYMVGVLSYLVD